MFNCVSFYVLSPSVEYLLPGILWRDTFTITFLSWHNLITLFNLILCNLFNLVLCTYNFSINRYCISQFSSLWQILYMVQHSTVAYNSIAHLLMESSRTSDLCALFKSVEGSANLTQGQDFGCYKTVSLLYQIHYNFF